MFEVRKRTIRDWAMKLGFQEPQLDNAKIMVYDIETSRAEGKFGGQVSSILIILK